MQLSGWDPKYYAEDYFLHEVAHTLHLIGVIPSDSSFDKKVFDAQVAAKAGGNGVMFTACKTKTTYTMNTWLRDFNRFSMIRNGSRHQITGKGQSVAEVLYRILIQPCFH